MSNELEVRRPIEIKDNSKERVAFDLLKLINDYDQKTDSNKKDKKYFITLYTQCLKATSGYPAKSSLEEE